MTKDMKPTLALTRTAVAATLVASCMLPAHADERESLESLRQTTLSLIDALVEQGVLSRAKADALVQAAKDRAAASAAAAPGAPVRSDAPGTIRVPYVPQTVRDQIRNEIKQEVLTQARNERWGVPNALPEWADRIKIDGDIRLRYQSERLADANADPVLFVAGGLVGLTRAADLTRFSDTLEPTGTTRDDRSSWRVRGRLGVTARVSDMVSGGIRLATGNTTNRVSTNQSLGQNFNKYQFLVDRLYVRVDPVEWLSVSGGRMPNPWFSTDLVWDEDLNFEGVAVAAKWPNAAQLSFAPFATVGSFPLKEESHTASGRWLHGVQVGASWSASPRTRLKFGVAQYVYTNIAGQDDNDYVLNEGAGPSYGQYSYPETLRQRGNTLFRTNSQAQFDSGDGDYFTQTNWGLASKFRPLAITAAAEFSHFSAGRLMLSADYVKNLAFDRNEIAARTGWNLSDGEDHGYQVKLAFGAPEVRQAGEWQASLAYRYLGSDAVLDAFTDSDFGLGGTNTKGYVLGFTYGLDRNATIGVKWLSSDSIDSPTFFENDRFSVDTLQVDLNVRF